MAQQLTKIGNVNVKPKKDSRRRMRGDHKFCKSLIIKGRASNYFFQIWESGMIVSVPARENAIMRD